MKYDLNRFKTIQNDYYPKVLSEIKIGKKSSHWMWFIFPQIAGLGKSGTSKQYEIANIEEAECYLMDDLLSKRLIELTKILAYDITGKTIKEIFGFPDYLKFHSSMTLFYLVVITNRQFENNNDYFCFEDSIRKYYNGVLDNQTLEILKKKSIFSISTPFRFPTTSVDHDDFNFKLEYIDLEPANKWKPPVGVLTIKNKENELLASIANAMGPLCWSLDKKMVVVPICKMHWLKGFHQKFVVIDFEKRLIVFLKEMHKGHPRIIDEVESDKFKFRHINKDNEVVEGSIYFNQSEIEEILNFK